MPLRNFYCVSEARYTLGIENQFTLREMVKQNTVIQSKFYSFPVLLVSLAYPDDSLRIIRVPSLDASPKDADREPIYPDSPFPVTPEL